MWLQCLFSLLRCTVHHSIVWLMFVLWLSVRTSSASFNKFTIDDRHLKASICIIFKFTLRPYEYILELFKSGIVAYIRWVIERKSLQSSAVIRWWRGPHKSASSRHSCQIYCFPKYSCTVSDILLPHHTIVERSAFRIPYIYVRCRFTAYC